MSAKEKTSDIESAVLEPEDDPFYQKFSPERKSVFVFIVALSVFLSPSSVMAFLPAASIIAKDFHTTDNVIIISNACYYIAMAISPCIMSPLGDLHGRRPMFLVCSGAFTLFTGLVAVSQNIEMFFVFRTATAIFGTAFFSLGGSIVSDIHIPQERGKAMGWTLSGSQLGPAFAPVIGGIIVTYTSWRVIFAVLAAMGLFTFGLSFYFLEETIRYPKCSEKGIVNKIRSVIAEMNPLRVLKAFRYLNLILSGVMSMSLIYNMCTLTTPIANVMNPRFHLDSPLYSGLFYLAPGMGYLVGSIFGGKWADRYVKKYIKLRGKRIPEDRLRSTYASFGIVLPASVLVYGWSLQKKKGGIALPVIALFFNGMAQTFCFPSINAYSVDCLPSLGGDAIASNYFIRYIAGAIGTGTCIIQIDNIGVGWSNTISAFVLLIGFGTCLALIKYGGVLRERAMSH